MELLCFKIFPYKYSRNQICKVGHGQPRFIICANLVGPTSPMKHTKCQGHISFGSREDILRILP